MYMPDRPNPKEAEQLRLLRY